MKYERPVAYTNGQMNYNNGNTAIATVITHGNITMVLMPMVYTLPFVYVIIA